MRKEAGYDVTDRIQVCYQASADMHKAIQLKKDYIQQEILAVSMQDQFAEKDFHRDWEIEKEKIQIGIDRIAKQ